MSFKNWNTFVQKDSRTWRPGSWFCWANTLLPYMPAKRKSSSVSNYPQNVYVVLQRSSQYSSHGDEHDVSCLSIHTTLADANEAAKNFFNICDDDDVETESSKE